MTNPSISFAAVKDALKCAPVLLVVGYFCVRHPGMMLSIFTLGAAAYGLMEWGDRRKAKEDAANEEWQRDLTPSMMPRSGTPKP